MGARVGSMFGLALALAGCSAGPSGDESSDATATGSETETSETEGWRPVLQAGPELGALMSVWGPSPAELFVAGGQPEAGLILRGYGSSWAPEALPPGTPMLNWVYGVDGTVWSVGVAGTIVRRDAPASADEPGAWVAEASPTDRTLWGVWGASAAELWAVGGDGVSDAPVLLRRDGDSGTWAEIAVPDLDLEPGVDAHALFKVWGFAADDVWVVGDAGASLHFDGGSWAAAPDPAGVDLISVWGSASGELRAVGGRASARIDRLVDGAWVGQTLAEPGQNGVWLDAAGEATVVGVHGSIHTLAPGTDTLVPEDSGTSMVLHAVYGFTGGPRYAVGGSLLMAPPYRGVILQHD